jgi:uncharacterized protein (DUF362 family)
MPEAPSKVATARCADYDLERVREAVGRCVGALPGLREMLTDADCVLLKPNLLSSRSSPDEPVNTHPSIVHATAEIVSSDFGCSVAIGDSCGSLSPSSTNRALENSGVTGIAASTGADVYNVDAQPRASLPFPEGRIFKEIPLPTNLDQFDLIISLPKLKTHHLTTITGAVKNLLGLVPGAGKKKAHLLAPRPDEFAALLCDLFACVRPGAAILDGVVGMEGGGPNNGDPRRMKLIAAGCDLFAVDALCARVMGLDPESVLMLSEGAGRQLGCVHPDEIDVVGEPVDSFLCPDFRAPNVP